MVSKDLQQTEQPQSGRAERPHTTPQTTPLPGEDDDDFWGVDEPDEVLSQNERYAKGKRHTVRVAEAMQDGDHRLPALRRCGNELRYRRYLNTGNTKLHGFDNCGLPRLCGFCAIRRAAVVSARYLERIKHVLSQRPELIPVHVTLTQRTCPDLRGGVKHLQQAFRVMTERRQRMRKGKRTLPTVLGDVAGGVCSVEVKRSKGNREHWHPHLHAVWLLERFIPQADLEAEWSQHLGQEKSMVWIDRVYDKFNRPDPQEALAAGVCEALKYSVKFDAMEPVDVLHADAALKRVNLLRPFGDLWGVKVPESLTDEPEEGPYVELCYRYLAGRYELHDVQRGGSVKYEEWQP